MSGPKTKKRIKTELEPTRKARMAKKKAKNRGKACFACSKDLSEPDAKALFVEEENGRIFCSEGCIVNFFSPEIKRLEKQYLKRLSVDDLSAEERKKMAQL